MDAWEILTSNSSLESGDVWEHLLSQDGGGSSCTDLATVTLTAKPAAFAGEMSITTNLIQARPPDFSFQGAVISYVIKGKNAAFAAQAKGKINGLCR